MSVNVHKSGFVSLVGKPNVGKSTLMNVLVGERLSIVTAKPQTTRHRIWGIVNEAHFQIIYTDTPGLLQPRYALQEAMMRTMHHALMDADVLLWLVDVRDYQLDKAWADKLQQSSMPVLLLVNKVDLVREQALEAILGQCQQQLPQAKVLPISALHQQNTSTVLQEILMHLPEHPPYFPKDTLTDRPERFFAAELIREQILLHYQQEIPYSVEVAIEKFQESKELLKISALIYTERKPQKAILIGKGGIALKQVGTAARQSLEKFFGKQVFLEQYVKVAPHWRKKSQLLKRMGYA